MKCCEAPSVFYALCAWHAERSRVERASSSATAADWELAVSLALKTRVYPVVYENARRSGVENQIPEKTHVALRGEYEKASRQALAWTSHFYQFARQMNDAGITFVPLKGFSMIAATFGDETPRPTGDIDVLLDERDVRRCAARLESIGWISANKTVRGVLANHGQEWVMRSPQGVEADLHWRFFNWHEERYIFKVDASSFLVRSEKGSWRGLPMRFLKKEDEFYYLLLSYFRNHRWPFRHLVDADALVRAHGAVFDWARLTSMVAASPLARRLGDTLSFMALRLETPFPEGWSRYDLGAAEAFGGEVVRVVSARGSKLKAHAVQWMGAENVVDKAALLREYLKWNVFKTTGGYRAYFQAHNEPAVNP